jgi:membrane protein DedA with SNARE-associated domain/uncharacterized membrane protein YkvA (DUF1232 family)
MLAENVFPPIPSELIMPLAGYVAAQGELAFAGVVLAGVAGSLAGALPWYFLGRWLGRERLCAFAARHGRWLTLDERELGQAIAWFERHGSKAVFLGRLVPAVRTLISLPAGMARMPLLPFLAWSAAGTVIWTAALAGAGLVLKESYARVGEYLDAVSKLVVGLIVLTYVHRLIAGGRLGARIRGWVARLRRDAHAVYLCARDPRVSWPAKAWALLVAAYAASPIDLIPDFIPVLGWADDLVLVPLGIQLAIRMIPAEVLAEHRCRADACLEAPRDWRIGALFVAVWLVASAFLVRWALGRFAG